MVANHYYLAGFFIVLKSGIDAAEVHEKTQ
jgi:hypothetical protein